MFAITVLTEFTFPLCVPFIKLYLGTSSIPLSVYSLFRLTVFALVVLLDWNHLVSCFVSYQPEQVHIAYGGKFYILLSV